MDAIVIPRKCGGWLAVTPPDAIVRIGVTAPTEEQARQKLAVALDRWLSILNDEETHGHEE